jgi:putative spermidine/putrescine transport system substrate-binding protein
MVESGNVQWDVVDVEADFALRAASEGLLEPSISTRSSATRSTRASSPTHGVGSFFFSFVLGYNEGKLGANKPVDWSALFDTKTYPANAPYKWPSPGVLELALLADGVPRQALPAGPGPRLQETRHHQERHRLVGRRRSQQLLASGEASMGSSGTAAYALQEDGAGRRELEAEPGHGRHPGHPKGAKNKDAAMKFLANASSAEGQADFANLTAYAPVNVDSVALDKDPPRTCRRLRPGPDHP